MARCKACQSITTADLQGGGTVKIHDSLRSLKDSAEQGCDFCRLCWTCLLKDNVETAKLDSHPKADDRVWLEGEGLDPVGRNVESKIWVFVGPEATSFVTGDSYAFGHLSIFADEGSPASKYVAGRSTTRDPLDSLHIALTKRWLRNCNEVHKTCVVDSRIPSMPTRVIDVRSSADQGPPFLLVTDPSVAARYVALSYVWGPNGHEVLLTHDTIKVLRNAIDVTKLSKTFTDAIQIARELGVQYLWTDALCIMQGDPIDWEIESKKMADIFGNAYLTIVAGSAADAHDGFLKTPLRRSLPPYPMKYMKYTKPEDSDHTYVDVGDCWVWLRRLETPGPVSARAWCFQEDILSPRRIVYGSEQMYFKCQRGMFREDGSSESKLSMKKWDKFLMPNAQSLLGEPKLLPPKDVMLRLWYEMLYPYTARDMTNPRDKLPAIAGTAKLVENIVGCRYLAGLWEDDLVRGLSWVSMWMYASNRGKPLTRPVASKKEQHSKKIVRAPSWSWASVDGAVWVEGSFVHSEKRWCDRDNFCIRPSGKNSGLWFRKDCVPNTISESELCVRGGLRRVQALNGLTEEKHKAFISRLLAGKVGGPRKKSYVVPLVPVDVLKPPRHGSDGDETEQPIGFGWFDVAEEKSDVVFCTRLIREQGLMLEEAQPGKFRRLGAFKVIGNGQQCFDEEESQDFILI